MKIFYAVQATGNGHISRARQLLPYLQKYGEVDVFLSGKNSHLSPGFEVKYKSDGLSLFYDKSGSIDKLGILRKNNFVTAFRDSKQLPLEKYDLILNDFDFITANAAKMKNLPSIQFGHQASFKSPFTPRPPQKNITGELLFNHFAPASSYVGLHFRRYDDFIFPPVIKEQVLHASPRNLDHICVYLPTIRTPLLIKAFNFFNKHRFQVFVPHISKIIQHGNVTLLPIQNELFTQSMIDAAGVITGGGFETPAEALFLGKKLLLCPINKHYEQQCNAVALEMLGIPVLWEFSSQNLTQMLKAWLTSDPILVRIEKNDLTQTLDYVFSVHEAQKNQAKDHWP